MNKITRAALVATTLGVVAATPATAQKSKDTLRIAFREPIRSVDFTTNPGPEGGAPARVIFDTLVYYDDAKRAFKPLLAKSWKQIDSKTLEFTLRDDVKFHDGSDFDADDVVYTVNWLADPKNKFRAKSRFLWVAKAEKLEQQRRSSL